MKPWCKWHNLSGPNSVTYLNQTPTFEWWVGRCGSKNRRPNDICVQKEIGLRAQNLLSILCSIANTIGVGGGGYDHLSRKIYLSLIVNDVHLGSKNCKENGYGFNLEFADHLVRANCVFHVLREVSLIFEKVCFWRSAYLILIGRSTMRIQNA